MKHQIEAACYCQTGNKRERNEDNFYFDGYILPQENNALDKILFMLPHKVKNMEMCGIFDGMGGEKDGEAAAYIAADSLKRECKKWGNPFFSPEKYLGALMERMNDKVWKKAEENYSGMGTTAVILFFCKAGIYVCNVGDSKAFYYHKGRLNQISKDHTDERLLRERGILDRKPHLTQYVGVSPDEMMTIEPYIEKKGWYSGDRYLICSDGLTDMVSDEEIHSIMERYLSSKECVDHLVKSALKNGGCDNVTTIVVTIK